MDEYDKLVTKTKSEMEKLDEKIVQLTSSDESFVITSSYLLNLANDNKKLIFNLLSPFDRLLALSQSSNWLALANELRTASMDYDESEVRNIKGLLLGVA